MDTLSIIILTAVVNALVTAAIGGIVLYRIQKKIDNSYFEHQTKFTQIHAKRVETLENLYKKFVKFYKDFSLMIGENFNAHRYTYEIDSSKYKNIELHLQDIGEYFINNRSFLTADTTTEIEAILENNGNFKQLIDLLNQNAPSPDDIDRTKLYASMLDENIDLASELDKDELNALVMNHIVIMANQALRLEQLYKLATEIIY